MSFSKCVQIYFNSILVRLKEIGGLDNVLNKVNFNSILVRLKVVEGIAQTRLKQFQFHSGAIKRDCWLYSFYRGYLFQFHSGAIKRLAN